VFRTDFSSHSQPLIPSVHLDGPDAASAIGFTSSGGLASVSLRRAHKMDTPTSVRDLLFTLLLKVGVASSIAALLARWNAFRRVLFTEERDPTKNSN